VTALADEEQTIVHAEKLSIRQLIAAGVFLAGSLWLATVVPSIEIAWVTCMLSLTIYLFVFEVVSVDVAAISIMVLLGLSSQLAPIMGLEQGLVDNRHLFDGFASNAVISIIAVMIIGAGLGLYPEGWRVHGGPDYPHYLGERRHYLLIYAERGRCCAVSTRGLPDFCTLRAAHVTSADANGLYSDPWRHYDHGGLQSINPAE
jgi:hypothetical protein